MSQYSIHVFHSKDMTIVEEKLSIETNYHEQYPCPRNNFIYLNSAEFSRVNRAETIQMPSSNRSLAVINFCCGFPNMKFTPSKFTNQNKHLLTNGLVESLKSSLGFKSIKRSSATRQYVGITEVCGRSWYNRFSPQLGISGFYLCERFSRS